MLALSLTEVLVVFGSFFLLILLLLEVLDWSQTLFPPENCPNDLAAVFSYGDQNGPLTWKEIDHQCDDSNQSPINIVSRHAVVVEPSEPLEWKGYRSEPLTLTLENNGSAVIVRGHWTARLPPYIQGGPLTDVYDFHSMIFHWGTSDDEGSEHTIDYVRYPMELQVVHVKHGLQSPIDATAHGVKDGVVIISFVFQIAHVNNARLDNVISNLWRVVDPGTKVHIQPIPLEWMLPTFERNYYNYSGSLTHPPCSEVVSWIVQPELMSISKAQIAEFRKLCSPDGTIHLKSRPLQKLNSRNVCFYA